jgi:hypothetical protein
MGRGHVPRPSVIHGVAMVLWIISRAFLIIAFIAMCYAMAFIVMDWREIMYEFDEDDDAYEDSP